MQFVMVRLALQLNVFVSCACRFTNEKARNSEKMEVVLMMCYNLVDK